MFHSLLLSLIVAAAAASAEEPGKQRFTFLSPVLDFQGDWETNNLNAFTQGGNVSVHVAASGITFTAKSDSMTVLVNGSQPAIPTNITGEYAEIAHLPYDWYEFTLVSRGNCTLNTVTPIAEGQRWEVNDTEPVNAATASSVTTRGDWTRADHRLSTTSSGASLDIDVPAGTAMLELLADIPPTPFGSFDVSISPQPPFGPASQKFTPALRPSDVQFLIGHLDVPVYSTILDPGQKYAVHLVVRSGALWAVSNVKYYP